MSKLTYIIDGYNVIHGVPKWKAAMDVELASARKMLCAYCAEWMSSRRDAESFIVVFDGDSNVSPFTNDAYRGVSIIYTKTGETADSRIIALADEMGPSKSTVVVSDDNEVTRASGMAGAQTESVREFIKTLRSPKAAKKGFSRSEASDELTPAQRSKITNDLKREWGIE